MRKFEYTGSVSGLDISIRICRRKIRTDKKPTRTKWWNLKDKHLTLFKDK